MCNDDAPITLGVLPLIFFTSKNWSIFRLDFELNTSLVDQLLFIKEIREGVYANDDEDNDEDNDDVDDS